MEKEKKKQKEKQKKIVIQGRGRIFKGIIKKVFQKRAVIEFERTVYIQKYERYHKKKTKLHAKIPENLKLNIGDTVKIQECRPISKITHFIIIKKINTSKKENESN